MRQLKWRNERILEDIKIKDMIDQMEKSSISFNLDSQEFRNDMKDNLSVQNLENNLVIVAKILNRGVYL